MEAHREDQRGTINGEKAEIPRITSLTSTRHLQRQSVIERSAVHLCYNIYLHLKCGFVPSQAMKGSCLTLSSHQEAVAENTLATEPWGVFGVEVWDP